MSFTVSATAARAVASPAFVSKASSKVRFVFVFFVFCFVRDARRATRRRDDAHRDVTSWTPPARAAREDDASNAPTRRCRRVVPGDAMDGHEKKKISIRSVFSSMRRG